MNEKTLIRDMAALISEVHHFARDGFCRLFRYDRGVYVPGGEFLVRQEVKRLLLLFGKAEQWSSALGRELVEFILLDAPELAAEPPADEINLDNGILNIWTRELQPHSPWFLSPIRIPVRLDPAATCPEIDNFVHQCFPADSTALAWEILGDLITPDRSIQKAVALIGEGGNGKGVFLQLATNFVGANNVAHLSMQKLETDRFAPARLYGKLANICPDLPGEQLTGSAVFKSITGCDRITAEFKYRDSFEFRPFARVLLSANHLPASRDAAKAFFDRWLMVPFPRCFRGTANELPRRMMDTILSSPGELSGALNRALPALRRLRREGQFTESATARQQYAELQQVTDPLAHWLSTETIRSGAASIPQDHLHAAYAVACARSNRPILSKQMFGRRLRALRPEIEEAQRMTDGRRQWVYLGIALHSEAPHNLLLQSEVVDDSDASAGREQQKEILPEHG
jgi:putative DNA primase/helicase